MACSSLLFSKSRRRSAGYPTSINENIVGISANYLFQCKLQTPQFFMLGKPYNTLSGFCWSENTLSYTSCAIPPQGENSQFFENILPSSHSSIIQGTFISKPPTYQLSGTQTLLKNCSTIPS